MSSTATPVSAGLNLFSGEPQYENFSRLQHLLPVREMKPSSRPFAFPEGDALALPTVYEHGGGTRNLHAFLGATHTSALLVLKDGAVRLERYWLTGGREVQWMSMSVAKSFTSALVGIAIGEGLIAGVDDPITKYVAGLVGTAYDGVRIKDVLQMSSGVRFHEDYSDGKDIARLAAPLGGDGTFDAFMATLEREREPGRLCKYSSPDTQALGMLVAEVTGRSLHEYMQHKLCEPLGMESSAYWITDSAGREMAFGGLLMTARDFAKLGELYRNGGAWNGRQIVPADYVGASIAADAPHLKPGAVIVANHVFGPGYGYQWWIPEGDRGEFTAIGVYNQFVYVDRSRGTVIVKLSANPGYGTSEDEEVNKDLETMEVLRAINRQFD
jgi:CubicO group peptidase (beta-lactamase class C family)